MKEKLDLHVAYCTGNVVRWNESLYVVGDIHDNSLELIPFDAENVTCHPSFTWPTKYERKPGIHDSMFDEDNPDHYVLVTDTTKTVDTVKVVARTIDKYLLKKIKKLLLEP